MPRTKYFYNKRYTYYGTATSGEALMDLTQKSLSEGWQNNAIERHSNGHYSLWVRDKE
jgi:hypothetical protein